LLWFPLNVESAQSSLNDAGGAMVCGVNNLSYSERPGELDQAIATWLQAQPSGGLRESAEKLTEAYRHGRSSAHINLAAYLTARLPATYAAVRRVLDELASIAPNIAPRSILDVGAGPGTASWAALACWPEIAQITQVEADARFAKLAYELAQGSGLPVLEDAKFIKSRMAEDATKADLVIAAYVFAELEERAAGEAALKLWAQCEQMLVIIEPGTPRGFARIFNARAALIDAGANVLGPCTHAYKCPMSAKDWCHFTQRLARSREHMHAKAASVPFEDEPFSWIAVSRENYDLAKARIVAPPITTKIGVTLKLCGADGLSTPMIASRDKAAYKLAKKLAWGDATHLSEN
jgi:ribosomal protein RSM22 (predicted rRNA methylase)